MKALYAISTGGCKDGIWLENIIDDFSKIDLLAEGFIKYYTGYNTEYISCSYNLEDREIYIQFIEYGTNETRAFELLEIGQLL